MKITFLLLTVVAALAIIAQSVNHGIPDWLNRTMRQSVGTNNVETVVYSQESTNQITAELVKPNKPVQMIVHGTLADGSKYGGIIRTNVPAVPMPPDRVRVE